MDEKQLIIRVAFLVLGGVGLWLLARRKNRNPWPGGIAGALSGGFVPIILPVLLVVLAFLKYKCPKRGTALSNEQARSGQCPACVSSATSQAAS